MKIPTKEKFLTVRWNNLLSLGLDFPHYSGSGLVFRGFEGDI